MLSLANQFVARARAETNPKLMPIGAEPCWQLHAKLTWAERIELDLWYVDHRSSLVDLKIVLRTPLALFGGTYKGETGGWKTDG